MELDIYCFGGSFDRIARQARQAERIGFGAMWFAESAHNAFLPCAIAAHETNRIAVGTAIALAFPRSPMVTAQVAWDLAASAKGRFILGLGTSVKAHIERRFSVPFSHPAPRLREYVLAVRSCFAAFQGAEALNFAGDFYSMSLLPPFFSPGPIDPEIDLPIYIAGVNAGMAKVAGEVCDGLHVHPVHSPMYLREKLLPSIREGAVEASRDPASVQLAVPVFVAVGDTHEQLCSQREQIRAQLAFYGSTRTYAAVFDTHGWGGVPGELHALQRSGREAEMADLITDDMLDTFAVTAYWDALPEALLTRYDGIPARVFPYSMQEGWENDRYQCDRWADVVSALRNHDSVPADRAARGTVQWRKASHAEL